MKPMEIIATVRRDRDRINESEHILDIVGKVVENGIKCLRFNVSKWRTQEELDMLRFDIARIRNRFGKQGIKILLDLPFPGDKPRINIMGKSLINAKQGECICLVSTGKTLGNCQYPLVEVNVSEIGDKVNKDEIIYYADGAGAFMVEQVLDKSAVILTALNDLVLESRKSLILGERVMNQENGEFYLELVRQVDPDIVALSFVETIDELKCFRKKSQDLKFEIMSKIETSEGVMNISEIARESDSIMLGRGDLGLHMDICRLSFAQNHVIQVSQENCKKVYVATDILTSLEKRYVPSRADVMDLTQIVQAHPTGIVLTYNLVRSQNIDIAAQLVSRTEEAVKNCETEMQSWKTLKRKSNCC